MFQFNKYKIASLIIKPFCKKFYKTLIVNTNYLKHLYTVRNYKYILWQLESDFK